MAEAANKLNVLKRKRTWKKGAITARMNKLEDLVNCGGSKSAMRGLVNGLHEVFSDLEKVCEEISLLSDELDELNFVLPW